MECKAKTTPTRNLIISIKLWIYIIHDRFKRWINTPPDKDDFFLINIRELKQYWFPCKHEWLKNPDRPFTRTCKWCDDYHVMMYNRYGNIRTHWESMSMRHREASSLLDTIREER